MFHYLESLQYLFNTSAMNYSLLIIIFLPLLSALSCGFGGYFIGRKGASIISVGSLFITLILSWYHFFYFIKTGQCVYIEGFTWINSDLLNVEWGFLFDTLTFIMLIVVTTVSTLVHLYSLEYMSADPHLPRFMSYLSLFTFFMLILVSANNLLQMFVGWEGVGLASYLLINFWFTRVQANKAAIKAMVINRIGDFGIILGMLAIFNAFKSLDYATIFALAPYLQGVSINIGGFEFDHLTVICIFLFIGAVGKSAQVGLHTWLPDAMEGPTPVSALIHAATMVTAGVFMICRCSPLFEYSPFALLTITLVGAMTAIFAGTIGIVQNDLKKVIAYSTCSQLGYMVFTCGLSCYSASMFHLANHAFFKALLFLGAGSVIHAIMDEQDMRRMGGLTQLLPFTYVMMFIGTWSLLGVPFLTGFYSKDLILEFSYSTFYLNSTFSYWIGNITVACTTFYSYRLLYLTFLNPTNMGYEKLKNAHEADKLTIIALATLAIPSITIGYFTKDLMLGLGSNFWNNSIFILPDNMVMVDSEFIESSTKLIPFFFSFIGGALSFFYVSVTSTNRIWLNNTKTFTNYTLPRKLYTFFNKRWFFDKNQNEFIAEKFIHKNFLFGLADIELKELVPFKLASYTSNLAKQTSRNHSGKISNLYTIFMTILLTTFMFYLVDKILELNMEFSIIASIQTVYFLYFSQPIDLAIYYVSIFFTEINWFFAILQNYVNENILSNIVLFLNNNQIELLSNTLFNDNLINNLSGYDFISNKTYLNEYLSYKTTLENQFIFLSLFILIGLEYIYIVKNKNK